MPFDFLRDCTFTGPAFPEPFVQYELERELRSKNLLPRATGEPGRPLQEGWDSFRRRLRNLVALGGSTRVRHQVIEPLVDHLGYSSLEKAEDVQTREGSESGGYLMRTDTGSSRIRVWSVDLDMDLDAPSRRGQAYRFSPIRIAQRVLLATGERLGLITNGIELRLLISDPARTDSQVIFSLDPSWKRSRPVPDSFLLLLSLASPAGVSALPDLLDKARLQQIKVTKDLRTQAREAIELFLQEVLDHPDNRETLRSGTDRDALAKVLWHEGLILVYRLLFILKEEAGDDPARSFSFSSSSIWRNTYSPTTALAGLSQQILYHHAETGCMLEQGMKTLFRMFTDGLECTELHIRPLGGVLFGPESTPILSSLQWGERAVAMLLDRLLWTTPNRHGTQARRRVHYGPLDVEDLGRVYEALLELEPGIATEPMCRLRRSKLEVVVPLAQGVKYRPAEPVEADSDAEGENEEEASEDSDAGRGGTRVQWIEAIPPGRFYLRVGLGRKASGSYYTPRSFVKFLVKETLGPLIEERSPRGNPQPEAILKLKVLDPAMGSGHFLVEACRFLGDALHEAFRQCDELAAQAERETENDKLTPDERKQAEERAKEYRQRITGLSDPDETLEKYLPSRAPEGEERGFSRSRARALCRRLAAVHCLYGVDKNPLAVELAKLSLWMESHAEGMPLTFLDHRLVMGDSLTGPFWTHLLMRPGSQRHIENQALWNGLIQPHFTDALREAIRFVRHLESKIGISIIQIQEKQRLKGEMDRQLAPFRVLAAAWTGGVMLGPPYCNDGLYETLITTIAHTRDLPEILPDDEHHSLREMLARGLGVEPEEIPIQRDDLYELMHSGRCIPSVAYDLTFPEVFYPTGVPHGRRGFDAVLGNPPWDRMLPADKEFFASFDFHILEAPTKRERNSLQNHLLSNPSIKKLYDRYLSGFHQDERVLDTLFEWQIVEVYGERTIGKQDAYRAFMEKQSVLVNQNGMIGVVVPSGFHANEGATGVRRLYLEGMAMKCCYSFENSKALFEIHRSFKFAVVVANRRGPTSQFRCGFYLHDDEWLHGNRDNELNYELEFVKKTGGEHLSLLELRTAKDLEVAQICFQNSIPFGKVCEKFNIKLGRELNMTDDAWRFTPTQDILPDGENPRDPDVAKRLLEMGYLVLHEGKTFHQFNDFWGNPSRYLVSIEKCVDKENWLINSGYYRIQFREITRSTDERTAIACFETFGCLNSYTATNERFPFCRTNSSALFIIAVFNSYLFDWNSRNFIQIHLTLAILLNIHILPFISFYINRFLAHSALRLTCNHAGYALLWHEQVGGAWREPKPAFAWPVLEGEDERWEVRAAIDAVVAEGYGLNRGQYEHVLSTFSHSSYANAPALCLAKFDELKSLGLDAFTKKYDPYWDIPLNENLPQPVIDIPMSGKTGEDSVEGRDFEYNLFGEKVPIERNLLGEPVTPKKKQRKSRR